MHRWPPLLATFVLVCSALCLGATPSPEKPDLLQSLWPAFWITHPSANRHDFGVFRLRKVVDLSEVPARFVVHVSGDRRYRLFVNGTPVSLGPQRSDPLHWRFETVDLAPQLHAGRNILAAELWNYSDDAPAALMGRETAFILQGDGTAEQAVNSDASWRIFADPSITAHPVDREALHTFIVVGPGQQIDGTAFPWKWTSLDFDDSRWPAARTLEQGTPAGVGTDLQWWLMPRDLPPMEEQVQRLQRIRRAEGVSADDGFITGRGELAIPAHHTAHLLLDQNFETIAFPHLVTGGGRGARITATYAEALIDANGNKGPRDEVEHRHILGFQDVFIADGGDKRDFSTLTFRTYRYIQLDIETADEPLKLIDFYGVATGYPLRENGSFSSDDPGLQKLWTVGWRTARLCAYETYTDCPYYEQLQYAGDTRIQALITLYVSGDDRLMRNAIELFDWSRLPIGLTQSRYPSTSPQIIPPFSLFWVQMVHDYWWHREDNAFVRARLLGLRNVLAWFEAHIDPQTGMLGALPYWCFVDWPEAWPWRDGAHPGGQPPGAHEGGSSIITLHFAWTLRDAADLLDACGEKSEATAKRQLADRLCRVTVERCWDPGRNEMADTPSRTSFSQHANAVAVLAGAIPGARATDLMRRVIADSRLTPCTLYFRYYLLRAMKAAGLGNEYVDQLQPWHEMVKLGLTTFAEQPDPTRSDCHAWSASPNYELLATVCGIEPGSPGFASVRIEPHLGRLTRVTGAVPHPRGNIAVSYNRSGQHLEADITLPAEVAGSFLWDGKSYSLHAGAQHISAGP